MSHRLSNARLDVVLMNRVFSRPPLSIWNPSKWGFRNLRYTWRVQLKTENSTMTQADVRHATDNLEESSFQVDVVVGVCFVFPTSRCLCRSK